MSFDCHQVKKQVADICGIENDKVQVEIHDNNELLITCSMASRTLSLSGFVDNFDAMLESIQEIVSADDSESDDYSFIGEGYADPVVFDELPKGRSQYELTNPKHVNLQPCQFKYVPSKSYSVGVAVDPFIRYGKVEHEGTNAETGVVETTELFVVDVACYLSYNWNVIPSKPLPITLAVKNQCSAAQFTEASWLPPSNQAEHRIEVGTSGKNTKTTGVTVDPHIRLEGSNTGGGVELSGLRLHKEKTKESNFTRNDNDYNDCYFRPVYQSDIDIVRFVYETAHFRKENNDTNTGESAVASEKNIRNHIFMNSGERTLVNLGRWVIGRNTTMVTFEVTASIYIPASNGAVEKWQNLQKLMGLNPNEIDVGSAHKMNVFLS